MRRSLILTLLCLLSASSSVIADDAGDSYLHDLISEARRVKLSEHRYWDLLLHYRQQRGGRESRVDDPSFFLSPRGRTDPAAELEATLSGFVAKQSAGSEHARCRFVARYAWLKEQLTIDDSRMSAVSCPEFDGTLAAINPRSVVLVFPVAYINSPASLFGHTLLRIDGGSESPLTSLAVNYAAVTADRGGFSYILKGVFGGYRGYYTALPYYDKVREYSAIENRDVWEYTLNLNKEEAQRIVLHLWEMRGISSKYYFFDENCSYQMLYLLELGRPSARLVESYDGPARPWVIPGDTVRVVVDSGMVTEVIYRPSQATRIRTIAAALPPEFGRLAYRVATGGAPANVVADAGASAEDQMRVLDLAADYIQYLALQHRMTGKEYEGRLPDVLHERGSLGAPAEVLYRVPTPSRPEEGHLPARIGLGGGCRTGSCFGELSMRPGYHDLLDDDDGYAEGAQIDILQTVLRYSTDDHAPRLYSLRLLDIESIYPRDLFFRPIAWKVGLGVEQKLIPGGRERLVSAATGGMGLAMKLGPAVGYILAETELNASTSFQDNVALGAGGSAGMLVPVSRSWKIRCSARGIAPLLGEPYRTLRGEIAQSFALSRNSSISVLLSREKTSGEYRSEGNALWNVYF